MTVETRMKYLLWDEIDGGAYVLVLQGEGEYKKVAGFRDRKEASKWVDRRLRSSRIQALEDKLFSQPWLCNKK